MDNAMNLPVVAVVGRPNVGKSTLFNRLVGSRRAIVGDEPGITRDRLYEMVDWDGRAFILVDTGGMIPDEKEIIPREILRHASLAIDEADAVLLVMDARVGVHPLDKEIHRLIRQAGKRCFLVANKVDVLQHEDLAMQFFELGAEAVYPVSAEHDRGVNELLDDVTADFPVLETAAPGDEIRVAVIGRPNVGKSSLVNRLLGTERVIVSDIPGTTRDAVDSRLLVDGVAYRLIDTAGIRRKGKTTEKSDKISVIMARKHLETTDIAILLLDPVEGITHMDATIAGYAVDSGAAVVLAINKADLLPPGEEPRHELVDQIRRRMKFLDYAPVLFFSAKTGRQVHKLFPLLQKAHQHRYLRIPTGALNQFFQRLMARRRIEALSQSDLGVKYLTQIRVAPPTFLLFTRRGQQLHFSEKRFIVNQLRKEFEFYANPLVLRQRSRR